MLKQNRIIASLGLILSSLNYSVAMNMPKPMAPKPYKAIKNPNINWKKVIEDNAKYHSENFRKTVLENVNPAITQILQKIRSTNCFNSMADNCLLLYGKTGTGKTTIAQVLAQEAGKFYTFVSTIFLMDPYESTVRIALSKIKNRSYDQHIIVLDNIECLCEKEHVSTFKNFLKECRERNKFIICTIEKPEMLPQDIRSFFSAK